MPDTPTMPHRAGRTGWTRPACCTARPLPDEAQAALAEAAASTDIGRDARLRMQSHAEDRRRAVLRASRSGASYRRIACELGVSAGNVQQLIALAREKERTT